jgi:hypothetical protein
MDGREAVLCLAIACLAFGSVGIVGCSAVKSWHRGQKRADANNNVKITTINVRRAQQQARVVAAQDAVVQAQADQRVIQAVGIRKAQDEVQKTLTPLYVQFEAVQAQLKMAQSPNHTIIYVPSGTNGTPVITQNGWHGDVYVPASGHAYRVADSLTLAQVNAALNQSLDRFIEVPLGTPAAPIGGTPGAGEAIQHLYITPDTVSHFIVI